MFAIFGQNLLRGKLGYCNLPGSVSYYGISQSQCLSQGYQWSTGFANFENVLAGLQTLFILSTQENWPNIMEAAMDSNDPTIVNLESTILNLMPWLGTDRERELVNFFSFPCVYADWNLLPHEFVCWCYLS